MVPFCDQPDNLYDYFMMSYLVLALVTFFAHLVWESAHIRLYRAYDALKGGASWPLPVPVWASLGDVVYTLAVVLLIGLFKNDVTWFVMPTTRDLVGLAFMGALIALFVEYKAFYFKRWDYAESMPIIPYFRVGLSSMIQKPLLFALTVYCTARIIQLM